MFCKESGYNLKNELVINLTEDIISVKCVIITHREPVPVTNAFGSPSRAGIEEERGTVSLNHKSSLVVDNGEGGSKVYRLDFFDFDTSSNTVLSSRALLPINGMCVICYKYYSLHY